MTKLEFHRAWYADALPSGEYVVLFNDHLKTHLGRVEFDPNNRPLYVRCCNDYYDGFKFAGQPQVTEGITVEWKQGKGWSELPIPTCGVSPVIYDNYGDLRVNVNCQAGSQGYRYMEDNSLFPITGDQTYGPTNEFKLWEWTRIRPDLVVGQGQDGGVIVWDRGTYRELVPAPASCRFIRVQWVGEDVSIAFWGETGVPTSVYLCTIDDLRSLPEVKPSVPPVIIPPVPPVEVPVKPIPIDVHATIKRFITAYPVPHGPAGDAHEWRVRHWMEALCQQLCYTHGSDYGWKRASGEGSKETFAYKGGDKLEGWELFEGVGTGQPKLLDHPEYHDLTGQTFIPVNPVDRLGRVSIRPAPPSDWRGLSSFDFGAQLVRNNNSWLSGFARGFNVLRVMVSRQSGTVGRSLEEGQAHLKAMLAAVRGTEFKLNVVLLCDTLDYTKDQMIQHVRRCNEILLTQAESVALVELANEIGHPTQSPDLMDIYLLEQLDSLVDVRFPLAWGGEFEGGSCVTWHSERAHTPDENAVFMGKRQTACGKIWIDDEMLGVAEPDRVAGRQRTADVTYPKRALLANRKNNLLRTTLHCDAGLSCDMAEVGPTQLEAKRLFLAEFTTTQGGDVTPQEIAEVFAGICFEDISKFLGLTGGPGTEPQRRPAIHKWARERVEFLDGAYRRVFNRPVDLEGAGSRLLLALKGWSDSKIEAMLRGEVV